MDRCIVAGCLIPSFPVIGGLVYAILICHFTIFTNIHLCLYHPDNLFKSVNDLLITISELVQQTSLFQIKIILLCHTN